VIDIEELKLLQKVVFPSIIDKYKDKIVFQLIDLRWGVTDEASNDQKTLELCIEEVGLFKHLNFIRIQIFH
jgi:hypothetical protein